MEDLIHSPEKTVRTMLDFIGMDSKKKVVMDSRFHSNKATDFPEWYIKRQTATLLKEIPGVRFVSRIMSQKMRNRIYKTLKSSTLKKLKEQQYLPPPMLPETHDMLVKKFQEPNKRLAEFINRDLSHWNR